MKEHDTLEELLYSYNEYLNKDLEHDNISVTEMAADNFLECNSLALGKQKPLAKNKQTESVCKCGILYKVYNEMEGTIVCTCCGSYKLANTKDASSR